MYISSYLLLNVPVKELLKRLILDEIMKLSKFAALLFMDHHVYFFLDLLMLVLRRITCYASHLLIGTYCISTLVSAAIEWVGLFSDTLHKIDKWHGGTLCS